MPGSGRLGYIDWMRGLAVVLMMQTHAYDSWLTPGAKATAFYGWSRLLGGYPAPLFLFLAGLSLALMAEARARHGAAGAALAREAASRGLGVLGWALAFRIGMLLSSGFARPADLFRVDVLNCIGLGMLLTAGAALGWATGAKRRAAAVALAAAIALLTPLAWDSPWPAWIPRPLLGYVSGRVPDAYFPLFPWAGFVAAGAAVGLLLARGHAAGTEAGTVRWLAAGGGLAIPAALLLDRLPQVYPRYDFWWTSPSYFMIKLGLLLLALGVAYAWGRLPRARRPSPLRQLGRTSLLVYWAHVEVVYGGILAPSLRKALDVSEASLGLALLTAAMLLLSLARTELFPRLRGRGAGLGPAPTSRAAA